VRSDPVAHPRIGIVAWIVAPIGLVLSIIGIQRANRLGGRGLGVSGAVLGAIALVICSLWVSALSSRTSGSSSSSTSGYSYSAPTSQYYIPSQEYSSYPSYPSYSATAPTTSAAPAVNGPFGSGTYLVGEDIAPGQYRTAGESFCGWSRNRDTTGDLDAIIANGIVQGPTTMTVRESDGAIEFSGRCTWTRR
jgi:hypothetical protein